MWCGKRSSRVGMREKNAVKRNCRVEMREKNKVKGIAVWE